jgi:hypothetical protein
MTASRQRASPRLPLAGDLDITSIEAKIAIPHPSRSRMAMSRATASGSTIA